MSELYFNKAGKLEKTLMLAKIEGRRRGGQQRMKLLGGISATREKLGQQQRPSTVKIKLKKNKKTKKIFFK